MEAICKYNQIVLFMSMPHNIKKENHFDLIISKDCKQINLKPATFHKLSR